MHVVRLRRRLHERKEEKGLGEGAAREEGFEA